VPTYTSTVFIGNDIISYFEIHIYVAQLSHSSAKNCNKQPQLPIKTLI